LDGDIHKHVKIETQNFCLNLVVRICKSEPVVKPPKLPNGWDSWAIWQYSDKGKVAGIDNNTDVNIMTKDFFDKYV